MKGGGDLHGGSTRSEDGNSVVGAAAGAADTPARLIPFPYSGGGVLSMLGAAFSSSEPVERLATWARFCVGPGNAMLCKSLSIVAIGFFRLPFSGISFVFLRSAHYRCCRR